MDAVYILGTGSLAGNEEIRYSVRSLALNMLDLGTVYVVGEKPEMLPGVVHVPSNDYSTDRWKNSFHKVSKACALPDVSEEFLFMNDDFFMLEPFEGAEFPFYALKGSNGGSCGLHSFHMHCPIRINKEWYSKMPFSADQKACRSPRTFYSNFYKAPPKFQDDFILRAGAVCRPFNDQIKGHAFFSIGDEAMLDTPFREWLHALYPEPSRFE